MVFLPQEANPPVQMLPGVTRRLVSAGERMMAVRFDLFQGSDLPSHSHPHEQIGFVVSGSLRLTVGDETRLLKEGDGYSIPSGVVHSAQAVEDTVAIDVFSPPREDYQK